MLKLKQLDLNWAIHAQLPPLDFVLPGLLPGALGLLVAPGGTGKSFLAIDSAVSIALGRPIAGGLFAAGKPAKVVYLAGEESDRLLAERLRCSLNLAEIGSDRLSNLILLPMSGEDSRLINSGKVTELFNELQALATGARLIILDPMRRLHDGDENNSADMTRMVVALENLGKQTGAAILGLHHANRASSDMSSQHASRGSSALVDGARWQINLSRMDEKSAESLSIPETERYQYLALDFAKSNYLPPRPRSWLKRQPGGAFQLVDFTQSRQKPKGRTVAGARLI
ncbi:MAG TPA: helicase RepA family protein [Thiobacillaceae bacterium]|nr:helicase RepA family protein [Thiobacillaceae bacterium]